MQTRSLCVALAALLGAAPATAQVGPAFTYQGEVRSGGSPATGPLDLRFRLVDAAAGGTQVGATLQALGVATPAGRFSVKEQRARTAALEARIAELERRLLPKPTPAAR